MHVNLKGRPTFAFMFEWLQLLKLSAIYGCYFASYDIARLYGAYHREKLCLQ